MKFAVCLLVLLPMVYCASIEERFLFTGLHIDEVVEILDHYLGSDTGEAACEAACPSILSEIPGGSLAAPLLCAPACKEVMRRGK